MTTCLGVGLLFRHRPPGGPATFLLTLRSRFVDCPGTWSVPGGAVEQGERPADAVVREVREECPGLVTDRSVPVAQVDAEGPSGTFITYCMDVPVELDPQPVNGEVDDALWLTADEIDELAGESALHPLFAATWPHLLGQFP